MNQTGVKNAVTESASRMLRVGDKHTRSRSFRRRMRPRQNASAGWQHSLFVAGCALDWGTAFGAIAAIDTVVISACAWLYGNTRDSESVRG